MEEKRYEKKLIKIMRDYGIYCVHMDTDVPGFPDIFSACNGKVVLIEVKDYSRGTNPKKIFESTQPQMYYSLKAKGLKMYLIRCNDQIMALDEIFFDGIEIRLGEIISSVWDDAGPLILRELFA